MDQVQLIEKLKSLRSGARELALLSTVQKNRVLQALIELLETNKDELLKANKLDVDNFKNSPKFTNALADRLVLNQKRINAMVESIKQIVSEPDLVGQTQGLRILKNGLKLEQVRVPIGVIFFIFESRPNVITEAFALALKSGNVMLMKGGRESQHSSAFIYELIEKSFKACSLSGDFLFGITSSDRTLTDYLLKQNKWIDLLIPRGGDSLIEYVTENSRIPMIKNDRGMCHVYIDKDADLFKAKQIVINAKTQRPGVCNAMETLIVHQHLAKQAEVENILIELNSLGVEIFACEKSIKNFTKCGFLKVATAESFATEYLDLKMNLKLVENVEQAIAHIDSYGSKHSEVILTENESTAQEFQKRVDAAVVYWNASSRFTDGFEFGLGGEIGISTQKLHVRGPIGLEALTCLKWKVNGTGQVRI